MYTKHFGLNALPFENSPDPAFFFDRGQYNQILATMYNSVMARRGLMVVSGPIGAGKTTLSHKLVSDLSKDTKIIWLVAPTSTVDEMVTFIAEEVGIPYVEQSIVFMIRDIRTKLLEMNDERRLCLMVIDESHMINDKVLEGVRILTNLEQGATKLLQIVLVGQEELVEKIERPELESFKQRIATQKVLGKMDFERAKEYVLHRLKVAGAETDLFSDNALEMVVHATNGIPRKINLLCHTAMRIACEQHKHVVEPKDVHDAAEEFGYGRETFHYLIKFKTHEGASISEELQQTPTDRSRAVDPSPEQSSFMKEMMAWKEVSWFWPLALLFLSFFSLAASLWYYALRFNLLL